MVDLIDTIVYAGRLKDKSALRSSSSGGAFTALSDFFLKNGKAQKDEKQLMDCILIDEANASKLNMFNLSE